MRREPHPTVRIRRYGVTAFAGLAEPKLTLRLSTRERRRMAERVGVFQIVLEISGFSALAAPKRSSNRRLAFSSTFVCFHLFASLYVPCRSDVARNVAHVGHARIGRCSAIKSVSLDRWSGLA